MTPVRVLVADDHDVVRHGLRALLESEEGLSVCAEAADGRQAVEMAEATRPHVAILDITMPEMNGLEACRRLSVALPRVQVLVLTMHESDEVVREVLAAGARGYVLKSDAGRELVNAVRALHAGETFFSRKVASLVVTRLRSGDALPPPRHPLTTREREIVRHLAEARSNKEVAAVLGIAVKTVEAHRANIMRKLGMHSVTELVRYAIRHQLVDP